MIPTLHDLQTAAGAIFSDLSKGAKIPLSFGNDAEAIQAAKEGVALYDRAHWGVLEICDDDRVRFLHNQSTNNFNILQPGTGCDTVFVTSTARTIDLATTYLTENSIIVILSPNRHQYLFQWLDRYIFPMDKIQLKDITNSTAIFSLIGPESHQLVEKLGGISLEGKAYATHQIMEISGISVRVCLGSSLTSPGYTLIVNAEEASNLWQILIENGVIPMGDRVWERLRIEQGRPFPDAELTDDYNPLEVRLLNTISYEKGCYIGQETIARLNTYKGVKQHLWGIRLSEKVEPGEVIMIGEEKVGKLTSITATESGYFGLGYIKTKCGGEGLKVKIGDREGEVVDVPFLSKS